MPHAPKCPKGRATNPKEYEERECTCTHNPLNSDPPPKEPRECSSCDFPNGKHRFSCANREGRGLAIPMNLPGESEVVELDGGKYRIVLEGADGRRDFQFYAERNGERWRELAGDKLVMALFQRVKELHAACGRVTDYANRLTPSPHSREKSLNLRHARAVRAALGDAYQGGPLA